ncbi:adenosine deaminase [Agromyces sp. SYSU T00266]|uniref:adenosine deaminase n=1 Tax=Agromyces zhanjiangensis TaxID=3158562 RepID=UPI00339463F3
MPEQDHAATELHCHLDGSVRPETIAALAREQGIDLPGPADVISRVRPSCTSLVEYISAIDVALDVLQTPEALYRAAYELVEDWHADGVRHGEARFAPNLHRRRGLDLAAITDAVASGLRAGAADTGVATRLILCTLRPSSAEATWSVVEAAASHDAVVGVDVAGPEAGVSLLPHAPAFRAARDAGLRITVHAGEADGPRSVWDAVDELGAERIGHGVRSVSDARLLHRLATDVIALEVCPTSNVQTNAVSSLAEHPIDRLRAAGVPVTVSCDARTASDVTLASERALLERTFGWTEDDWGAVQSNAERAAFVERGAAAS